MMEWLDWTGLYNFHKLNEIIVPDAAAHPAKFPWGLVNKIIDFCFEKGFLKPNDLVADPFAGIGTGGIACAYKKLRFIGCELEPRFVNWARLNFAKHAAMWDKFGLPHPIICQGDSRNFAQIVREALAATITSPPYADTETTTAITGETREEFYDERKGVGRRYGHDDKNLGNMPAGEVADAILTSPPFTDENNQPRIGQGTREQLAAEGKQPRALNQTSDGNIANLPAEGGLDAVVSSPVYADQVVRKREATPGFKQGTTHRAHCFDEYGESDGQIADCAEGDVEAVVPKIDAIITSPVYGSSLENPGGGRMEDGFGVGRSTPGKSCGPHSNLAQSSYGTSDGQISGCEEGEVDAVLTSPPFSNIQPEKNNEGIDLRKQWEHYRETGGMSFEAFVAQQKKHSEGYGKTEGQLGNIQEGNVDVVLSSPSYPKDALGHAGGEGPRTTDAPHTKPGTPSSQCYGESKENVGNQPEGSIDLVATSPPYAGIVTGCGGLNTKPGNDGQQSGRSPDAPSQQSGGVYSEDEKNLSNASEGVVDSVLTSPPFVNTEEGNVEEGRKGVAGSTPKARMKADYVHGDTPGQISRLPEMSEATKNTYWGACRLVYEEVWKSLKPSGIVALVVKDFCRAGVRVPLCTNTARLLEAIGFEMLYRVRSHLVEKTDLGAGFLGGVVQTKRRSSFFRRLYEDNVRYGNWWKTLAADVQTAFLLRATSELQGDYQAALAEWNEASEEERVKDKMREPKVPTEKNFKSWAMKLAHRELCDLEDEELEDDRVIDFEEILIARKPA